MKTISCTLMILILGSMYLYADEIYLKDGSVKNGKIISVTDLVVAYDPEGDIAYEVIKRSKIVKIVYANGKEVVIDEEALEDMNNSKSIDYKYGVSPRESKEKKKSSKRSYKDSFIYIGLVGAWGFNGGDICDKEKRLNDTYGNNDSSTSGGEIFYGGCELDLMFPARVKFGVKGRFLGVVDDDEEDDNDDGPLFSYRTLQVGPVVDAMIFETRVLAFSLQFYGLYGRIYKGNLNAMTGLRGRDLVHMTKSQYHTTFGGYTCSFGVGPRITFNSAFPVSLGMNLNYTFAKFKFDKKLAAYNSDHTSYDSITIEFVAGVAF